MTTHKPAPDNPPAAPSAGPERQQPKFGTRVSLSSNAIAGVAAGFSSSVITHPLDVVKTRFQVHDGIKTHVPKYRSTLHALVQIARSEGVVTLYAGLSPNLLGSTVSWGSYFYCYNLLRGLARREQHLLDSAGQLGPLVNLTCATCSGFLTCLATNPIWLVKTRLQLQQGRLASDATAHGVRYNGMLDAFIQIGKSEGAVGLYRGLVPSLFLVSHGSIQFATYEEIKKVFRLYNDGTEHLSTLETLAASSLSKVVASTVTYPNQVVRSRLQQVDPNLMIDPKLINAAPLCVKRDLCLCQKRPMSDPKLINAAPLLSAKRRYCRGTWFVATKIFVATNHKDLCEGTWLLQRNMGISPNLMRVVPSSCITFVVYETVAKFLNART